MALASIPAGTFSLGCAAGDADCADNEKPPRTEKVMAFWMDTTDVTVAAYQKCVAAGSCTAPNAGDKCNYPVRPDHPANCVDWHQASAFCGWDAGRLPTAVEWEYAAKSGRDVIYPWGNAAPDPLRAKYDSKDGTAPVGAHPAGNTPWGLKDMAGNVWQWTADTYDASSYEPTAKEVRGGAWFLNAQILRTSLRGKYVPEYRHPYIGFRCVQPSI